MDRRGFAIEEIARFLALSLKEDNRAVLNLGKWTLNAAVVL